ncbi:MAG: trypsin-like peptidase domain-containing protein [Pirellulaceae bacterium]
MKTNHAFLLLALSLGLAGPVSEFTLSMAAAAEADDSAVNQKLYRKLLPSVCWVRHRPDANGSYGLGTGWLLDASQKLVVTNDHVVTGQDELEIDFPEMKDGQPIVEPDHYLRKRTRIIGTVIHRDHDRDLALLQLSELPAGAKELKLADKVPAPGEKVVTIASLPRGSEGLWIFTVGTVRMTYRRSHANGAVAHVVETDMPFNQGNSGGPVINDRGELVSVVEGFQNEPVRQVSMTISVDEVRAFNEICKPLIDPTTAEQFLQRGQLRRSAGRYDVALADLSRALELDSNLAAANVSRGWILFERHDYETAIAEFDDAVAKDGQLASAYAGRGTAHRQLGNTAEALKDLTQAIRRDSNNADYYLRRGQCYNNNNQCNEAIADLNRCLKIEPKNAVCFAVRAVAQRRLNKNQEAIKDFQAALQLNPRNDVVWAELALTLHYVGQDTDGVFAATQAIQLSNDAAYHNVRGRCLQGLNRNEEAAADYEAAAQLEPSQANYFLNAGTAYIALQKYERAAELLSTCISLDPNKARAYHERATAYEGLGQPDQAAADETKAEELEQAAK